MMISRRCVYFNSRPSARGDHAAGGSGSHSGNFNSRPSARGDRADLEALRQKLRISIHAPPRGATERRRRQWKPLRQFQFTPLREGRPCRFACCFLAFCISIHAPPRGATTSALTIRTKSGNLNSRPSARGDNPRRRHARRHPYFNSRPSARGDRTAVEDSRDATNFNSRPSARGDARWLSTAINILIFQFTPLREGRHPRRRHARRHPYFNSRPSARGDVQRPAKVALRPAISIHAPPRGATRKKDQKNLEKALFQFTPLREGRRPFRGREVLFRRISIHAPPRGATKESRRASPVALQFQFTPLREGRLDGGEIRLTAEAFQFTPLREGRRSDQEQPSGGNSISIHAPPRGATTPPEAVEATPAISIHAPPRGATATWRKSSCSRTYFISRPSARGDEIVPRKLARWLRFQFTPLREGRPQGRTDNRTP